MAYYTQCPACLTVYHFHPPVLEMSQGRARCGTCGTAFDAYAQVYEALPPLPTAPVTDAASLWGDGPSAHPFGVPRQPETAADTALPQPPTPERLRWLIEADAPPQRPHWLWGLGSLCLSLLLVGQVAYGERLWLVQHYPASRPFLEALCHGLGCTLPVPTIQAAWQILHREVGPHPGQPEAWLAEISFLNDSAITQPYPLLELVLLDERGAAYAGRRFHAPEYLPPSETAAAAQVAPQAIVFARLVLRAPTPPASGFRFQFHPES